MLTPVAGTGRELLTTESTASIPLINTMAELQYKEGHIKQLRVSPIQN